jgi:hypothetical protein
MIGATGRANVPWCWQRADVEYEIPLQLVHIAIALHVDVSTILSMSSIYGSFIARWADRHDRPTLPRPDAVAHTRMATNLSA